MAKSREYTILVVEDEVPLLNVIKKKLELSGFTVVSAREVEQALEYLKTIKDIHAIWLDHYLLGEKDGIDFVGELKKENSSFRSIPVFVVSNTASIDKVSTYMELGVTRYYTKANYRLDEIIADIRTSIEKRASKNT